MRAHAATKDRAVGDLYEQFAVEDIKHAADVLRPVHDATGGADGYISMEVSPYRAPSGIRDKPIAPASPWQNAFAERLIGSIRR
jgi:hypothetical protein